MRIFQLSLQEGSNLHIISLTPLRCFFSGRCPRNCDVNASILFSSNLPFNTNLDAATVGVRNAEALLFAPDVDFRIILEDVLQAELHAVFRRREQSIQVHSTCLVLLWSFVGNVWALSLRCLSRHG